MGSTSRQRDVFAGISLLPDGGDSTTAGAIQPVLTTAELIENYGDGAMYASGIIEEASGLRRQPLPPATPSSRHRGLQPEPEIADDAKSPAMMDEYKHN